MVLYVVYFWSKGDVNGYGDYTYIINADKLTIKDVSRLRKHIMESKEYDNVVILNWKRMGR